MRLRFSLRAMRHIDAIHDYVAKENRPAADDVVAATRKACERLRGFSSMGRPGTRPSTREWSLPRLPYIIVYAVDAVADEVAILAVLHTRRKRD